MDYKKLIKALIGYFDGKELKRGDALKAADAIETLLKERDAIEIKRGKWIHTSGNLYCCSVCYGYPSYIPAQCNTSEFCPRCGAKMDLES